MEIWLGTSTKDMLQLPVLPQSIGADDTRNFEDIILASGDEKTVISGRNLRSYSLESFFPKVRPIYMQGSTLKTPMEYVKKIRQWMDNKEVLQFIVTTTNINEKVTIRSFNWQENGGTVGDIEYTIELKEYRGITYSTSKVTNPITGVPTTPSRPPSPPASSSKTYTVVRGDSLWKIASKYYGSGTKWPTIYNANKGVIGGNPNLIKPGQKLVIP